MHFNCRGKEDQNSKLCLDGIQGAGDGIGRALHVQVSLIESDTTKIIMIHEPVPNGDERQEGDQIGSADSGAVSVRIAPHGVTENAKTLEYPRVLAKKVGDEGLEPPHDFGGKNVDRVRGDAESDASAEAMDGDKILDDAGLAAIVEAWPMLSTDARRVMLELVDTELGAVVVTDRER